MLRHLRPLIPQSLFPYYHYTLSLLGAVFYGFPGKKLTVILVTGTKGKSSTTEFMYHILKQAGYKTAVSNTIHFMIDGNEEKNLFKMSTPGRFFIQRFLNKALRAGCTHVVLEMSSQAVLQSRHLWLYPNALIFTNLSPEHLDSHGTYDAYLNSKLEIALEIQNSTKRPRILVANQDDQESEKFLAYNAEKKIFFSGKDFPFTLSIPGEFNKYNAAGAVALAKELGISEENIKTALINVKQIAGRLQYIECGQDFDVIVDYAHTTDSLQKLYDVFKGKRKIAVLGGTGGGRDKWKRKEMGAIADRECEMVYITNEDPYDEDPQQIMDDVASGVTSKKPVLIFGRRDAIKEAIKHAQVGDVILISGKGTDPYIMGPNGGKLTWSDAKITEEVLKEVLNS
jgi:UDP-N-acetylmuramoyl-L-alanyl-D-glutamate--2,6-diaminopimelate ligase